MDQKSDALLSLQHFKLFGPLIGAHDENFAVVFVLEVGKTHQGQVRTAQFRIYSREVGQTTLGQHIPDQFWKWWFQLRSLTGHLGQ
jgi:hypothetical protein